jgi:hypothetical protein
MAVIGRLDHARFIDDQGPKNSVEAGVATRSRRLPPGVTAAPSSADLRATHGRLIGERAIRFTPLTLRKSSRWTSLSSFLPGTSRRR